MESLLDHTISPARSSAPPKLSAEIQRRIEAYLRVWRLPAAVRDELLPTIVECVQMRLENDPDGNSYLLALEEADKFLVGRINEMLGNATGEDGAALSIQQKIAMLWGDLPGQWQSWTPDFPEPTPLAAAYAKGTLSLTLAQQPQRPLETRPMVMHTSLSRLPSFRIVAGWFLLMVLLALAFILTR